MKHPILRKILKITGIAIGSVALFIISIPFIIFLTWLAFNWLRPELSGSVNVGNGLYCVEIDYGYVLEKGRTFSINHCEGGSTITPHGYLIRVDRLNELNRYDSILFFTTKNGNLGLHSTDSTIHYYLLDKTGITDETLSIEIRDRLHRIDSLIIPRRRDYLSLRTNPDNICWPGLSAERKHKVICSGQIDSFVMRYCNGLKDIRKNAERDRMFETLTAPQPENDIFALNLYVLTRIMKEYDGFDAEDADIVKTIGRYIVRNLDNNTENVLISLEQNKEYASYYLKYLARELDEIYADQKNPKITLKDLVLPSTAATISSDARLKRIFDALATGTSEMCAEMHGVQL